MVEAEEVHSLATDGQVHDPGLGRLRLQSEVGEQNGQPARPPPAPWTGTSPTHRRRSGTVSRTRSAMPGPAGANRRWRATGTPPRPAGPVTGRRTEPCSITPARRNARSSASRRRSLMRSSTADINPEVGSSRNSRPRPSPPPSRTPKGLIQEHLQLAVRRASRAEPERARQEVRFEDRLKHDLHRGLHDPVPNRRNRQRPPLLGPRLRYEYLPGRQRAIGPRLQLRFQLVEQPGHPVPQPRPGGLVDARRAVVAAHLTPRPLQDVPAVDLVIQRVEPSSGIGLGRPVKRML